MRRETFYKALGFVIVADTDNNVKQNLTEVAEGNILAMRR